MCLDARKLNDRTLRDSYLLPHQDRILGRLGASKYLSTIDLSKAFWQIPLDPESRKYTAFRVFGRGLFQFTRLPFGFVNSPALMDHVLGYGELEPNVFVYVTAIMDSSGKGRSGSFRGDRTVKAIYRRNPFYSYNRFFCSLIHHEYLLSLVAGACCSRNMTCWLSTGRGPKTWFRAPFLERWKR